LLLKDVTFGEKESYLALGLVILFVFLKDMRFALMICLEIGPSL